MQTVVILMYVVLFLIALFLSFSSVSILLLCGNLKIEKKMEVKMMILKGLIRFI